MRKLFSILYIMAGLFVITSCEDDSPKAILTNDIAPNLLDAPSSASYVLTKENSANSIDEFKWTASDYILDVTVTYTLQLDIASNNFANAITLFSTEDLSGSITVGDINKKLLDFGLAPEEESSVEIRVKASVSDHVAPVYSNIRQFSVTPYATSFPPIYIIGDAQSWSFDKAVKVKKTGPGLYVTTANFVKDGTFRFFETLSWSSNVWNSTFFDGGTVDANLASAGDKDSNFKFVGESGTYTITVSTKDKTITLEAAATPELYMLGDGQGWAFSDAVALTWLGGGHFQAASDFSGGKFRFFKAINNWNGYGYDVFTTFVDPVFVNANDGDKNFSFVGTAGSYTIDVDLDYLTVNMK